MKQVTVSIVTYCALPDARRCIAAVLNSKDVDFDVILTSNSLPATTRYFEKIAAAFPDRVRVVVNPRNEGFIAPNVKALGMTNTPFFLMLNDDTQIPSYGLARMLAAFDNPKVALVGGSDGCTELDSDYQGRSGPGLEYAEGTCLMGRTEILRKYGLFDPNIKFAYCEDSDLSLRMRELGYLINRVPLDLQHVRCATSRFVPEHRQHFINNHAYCRMKWGAYLKTPDRLFACERPAVTDAPITVTAAPVEPPAPIPEPTFKLTLVTCTGDRPEAFALTERYVARQTLKPFQWIVLDDGVKPTVCTMGQHYRYDPKWRGRNSMTSKLATLFEDGFIQGDGLVFWEDDDWYAPTWLDFIASSLEVSDVVGEGRALYYNVKYRYWFEHANMDYASLCSTAIARSLYPVVKKLVLGSVDPFVDGRIWKQPTGSKFVRNPLAPAKRMTIGIKAVPGRPGYGSGHGKPEGGAVRDRELKKLRDLIGSDADNYTSFFSK